MKDKIMNILGIVLAVIVGVLVINYVAKGGDNPLDSVGRWEDSHKQVVATRIEAEKTYKESLKSECLSERTGATLKLMDDKTQNRDVLAAKAAKPCDSF